MEEILPIAQQFISLYYSFVSQNKLSIDNFQAPEPKIWGNVEPSQHGFRRFPDFTLNNELNVTDYAVVPVLYNKTFNVTVTGNFTIDGKTTCFTQAFTLKTESGKTSIISDCLTFTPADSVIVPEKELINCPPYQRNKQSNKQSNKFKPYVPKVSNQ